MSGNDLPKISKSYSNNSQELLQDLIDICQLRNTNATNQSFDNWKILINFYSLFVSWFVPILIVFGEVGTLLCLIVLLKRRTGSAETRMWFVALSISDMYSLAVGLSMLYSSRVQFIFPGLMKDQSANHLDLRHNSLFSCYLLNGMVYFGLLVSTWIQVGISVLRVVSVKSNVPAGSPIQRRKFSIALVVCILFTLLVTFLLIGFSMDYRYPTPCLSYKMCVLKPGVNQYFFYVSLIIKVLLPTVILLACSIMIINHLKKFKRQFASSNNDSSNSITTAIRKRVKQKHISYTLLGMNLTFFILTLPFEVYKIYFFYNIPKAGGLSFSLIRVIDKMLNIILYTNNATNWLFYFMLGKRFRENMKTMMCKRREINCRSIFLKFRRLNSFFRSKRCTPVRGTTNRKAIQLKHSSSPENNEDASLVGSQPKFHCAHPVAQNTFPKFY